LKHLADNHCRAHCSLHSEAPHPTALITCATFDTGQCSKDFRAQDLCVDGRGSWIDRDLIAGFLYARRREIAIGSQGVVKRLAADSRCCGWRGESFTATDRERAMIRSITNLLFFIIVLALPPGVAFADDQQDFQTLLRGEYRYSGTESCVDSPSGFSPAPFFLPLGATTKVDSSFTGLISFDGNGNAVATAKSMSAIVDPQSFPIFTISTANVTCNYTNVTVNPDRSFTMLQNSCAGKILSGNGAGVDIEIIGGVSHGFIGQFKQVLLAPGPGVEPIQQEMRFNGFFGAYRLCHSAATYMRASTQ